MHTYTQYMKVKTSEQEVSEDMMQRFPNVKSRVATYCLFLKLCTPYSFLCFPHIEVIKVGRPVVFTYDPLL